MSRIRAGSLVPARGLALALVALLVGPAAGAQDAPPPAPAPAPAPPSPPPPPALFEDATRAVGLEGVTGARVGFADLDGDGLPDALIDRTLLFHARRAGTNGHTRTHLVRAAAIDAPWNRASVRRPDLVLAGDVNGDGRKDLYFGRSTDLSNERFEDDGLRSEVWLQAEDGSFARVEGSGVGARAETTIAACFVDYDKDGVLDLFVGSAYTAYGKSLEAFPDRLYRGKGDGRFEDVTEAAGLLGVAEPGRPDSRRPTYGVTAADWNQDGWPDLFAMSYGRQWNRLWKNQGDGTFVDVGAATGFDGDADRAGVYPEGVDRAPEAPFRANGNSFDFAIADVDGDGDLDGFLCEIAHWWAGSSSDRSMLLVNRGPAHGYAFERRPGALPARPHADRGWNEGDLHAGWLDIDNDGRLDLVLGSSDYPDEQLLRLYRQRADGGFDEVTERLGIRWRNATQIALADLDRDGATDILVGTSHMRLSAEQRAAWPLRVGLLRNRAAAASGHGFLSLRLRGRGEGHANVDAIGARVTMQIGEARQMREVQGGLGLGGHQDDLEVRFGTGSAAVIDRVEVRWPDRGGPDAKGAVQVFEDVPARRFYRLVEGGALEPGR